jgi:hypothetical protein
MLQAIQLIGFGGKSRYVARPVNFDGTNDYILRGSDMTGSADGKTGTFSYWLKLNGGDNSLQIVFRSGAGFVDTRREAANTITVGGTNSVGTQILLLTSTGTYTVSTGWVHILSSWNLATAFGKLYINDVDVTAGGATLVNDTIDYTQTDWACGARTSGDFKLNADLADLWFSFSMIDITVEANRRRFISAARKPIDLGQRGELPNGSQPIVFFKGPASAFNANIGTGGNMTVTGALTDSTTSPSS